LTDSVFNSPLGKRLAAARKGSSGRQLFMNGRDCGCEGAEAGERAGGGGGEREGIRERDLHRKKVFSQIR
jgi:hypothetical protein